MILKVAKWKFNYSCTIKSMIEITASTTWYQSFFLPVMRIGLPIDHNLLDSTPMQDCFCFIYLCQKTVQLLKECGSCKKKEVVKYNWGSNQEVTRMMKMSDVTTVYLSWTSVHNYCNHSLSTIFNFTTLFTDSCPLPLQLGYLWYSIQCKIATVKLIKHHYSITQHYSDFLTRVTLNIPLILQMGLCHNLR